MNNDRNALTCGDNCGRMYRLHSLKLSEEFYGDVRVGRKTFEVRVNDRGFQAGDKVELREVRGTGIETGAKLMADIGYVLSGWGIERDRVVFSLLNVREV